MITVRLIYLFAVCALLPACAPVVYTLHDGVRGRVVDAHTRQPLAGAQIAIYAYRNGFDGLATGSGSLVASTHSGADGVFTVPAQQQVALFIVGMDFGAVRDTVAISRAGYQSVSQPLPRTVGSPFGPSMEDLGSVTLHPIAR